jgi:uncharacterized protein YlaI
VELEASLEVRLKRNRSSKRLKHKPSKNYFKPSEKELLETNLRNILNSGKIKFKRKNHIKINNQNLSAVSVAKMISERFDLRTGTPKFIVVDEMPKLESFNIAPEIAEVNLEIELLK